MFFSDEFFSGIEITSDNRYIQTTPPKFNIAPEKRWLEDDPFLLGSGNFSGANC